MNLRGRVRLPMGTSTRRAAVGSVAGIALVLLGVLAATGPAVGDQTVATSLLYSCQFPSGAHQVTVSVDATFPETAQVGVPIAPTNVSAKLDLPQASLAEVTKLKATTVTATAGLSIVRGENGSSATLSWSGLTSPGTTIPRTGDLNITVSGAVPSTTVAESGRVSFAADALGLVLSPSTASGAATNPATVTVACTLAAYQNPTLATVAVTDANSATPTPPPTPTTIPGRSTSSAAGPNAATAPPTTTTSVPPGSDCKPFTGPTIHPKMVGKTNLNKLGESSVIGPGQANLTLFGSKIKPYFTLCYEGTLQLPSTTTTVLAFGFMPITTTLTYVQDGPVIVEAWSDGPNSYAMAWGQEYIVITTTSVNGQPLDLGRQPNTPTSAPANQAPPPGCRTAQPVQLVLSNPAGTEYSAINGGYLEDDDVTVPPFIHCGVDENLDSLLSAPVSGSGNLVRMCQESTIPGKDFVNCKQP